jgi:hypothetical protein
MNGAFFPFSDGSNPKAMTNPKLAPRILFWHPLRD